MTGLYGPFWHVSNLTVAEHTVRNYQEMRVVSSSSLQVTIFLQFIQSLLAKSALNYY